MLSGYQKARVALMRVLLPHPRALLLDDPFSKLDSGLRASFPAMVCEEAERRALPVLMVMYDPQDAAAPGEVVSM